MLKNLCGYGTALAGFLARSGISWGGPVSIAIEPANICNLKCPLCAAGSGSLTRPQGYMVLDDFKSIVDMLPESVTALYLWGQGEPFLAPDFLSMVKYASASGRRIIVSTNGHFLDDSEGIVKSGMDRLIISLDGTDGETYRTYRAGGDFNCVVRGIRNLSLAKKKAGAGPFIELQCLVTRSNVQNMKGYRSFALELGADRAVFKTLQAASFKDGFSFLPEDEMLTRYRNKNGDILVTDTHQLLKNRCFRIYNSLQIDWQGNVVPCCFDKDSVYILGNIHESPLSGIWNSDAFRSFRRTIASKGRVFPMCRDCTEGIRRMTVNA